ncbi:MAG: transcription termination factor NusA [Patescibacteria group bacterium]|nr:transcription termination factor NusA [Patescibacteria group bacterium]
MFDLKNLGSAIAEIAEERGIPQNKIVEVISEAIASAYKKEYGRKKQKIVCSFDLKTGDLQFWQIKEVVSPEQLYTEEEIEALKEQRDKESEQPKKEDDFEIDESSGKIRFNPERHILLEEAKKTDPEAFVGNELKIGLPVHSDFGRIAAQTAKQVILQRIREVEKDESFKEFKEKEGEVVSGIIQRIESGAVFFDIGRLSGVLPKREQIPGEKYRIGQRLKLYVLSTEQSAKGPQVVLSRIYPKLISKLFELEVPEISAQQLAIKGMAREAGFRSKIAVEATEEGIDPIGAMVGQRGTRIMAVTNELAGEKIDVILWDEKAEKYIANALSPAKVLEVRILPRNKAQAIIQDEQLSLAIGKEGQNVRLAAKLTGWKIDVRSVSQIEKGEDGQEFAPDDEESGADDAVVSEETDSENLESVPNHG